MDMLKWTKSLVLVVISIKKIAVAMSYWEDYVAVYQKALYTVDAKSRVIPLLCCFIVGTLPSFSSVMDVGLCIGSFDVFQPNFGIATH